MSVLSERSLTTSPPILTDSLSAVLFLKKFLDLYSSELKKTVFTTPNTPLKLDVLVAASTAHQANTQATNITFQDTQPLWKEFQPEDVTYCFNARNKKIFFLHVLEIMLKNVFDTPHINVLCTTSENFIQHMARDFSDQARLATTDIFCANASNHVTLAIHTSTSARPSLLFPSRVHSLYNNQLKYKGGTRQIGETFSSSNLLHVFTSPSMAFLSEDNYNDQPKPKELTYQKFIDTVDPLLFDKALGEVNITYTEIQALYAIRRLSIEELGNIQTELQFSKNITTAIYLHPAFQFAQTTHLDGDTLCTVPLKAHSLLLRAHHNRYYGFIGECILNIQTNPGQLTPPPATDNVYNLMVTFDTNALKISTVSLMSQATTSLLHIIIDTFCKKEWINFMSANHPLLLQFIDDPESLSFDSASPFIQFLAAIIAQNTIILLGENNTLHENVALYTGKTLEHYLQHEIDHYCDDTNQIEKNKTLFDIYKKSKNLTPNRYHRFSKKTFYTFINYIVRPILSTMQCMNDHDFIKHQHQSGITLYRQLSQSTRS